MKAGLMSLQPCLYFAFHHPLTNSNCAFYPQRRVLSLNLSLWGQRTTDTEAGLNHCSLTEHTVYSAEGGLGCSWHVDKYYVRVSSESLGSGRPVNKTMWKLYSQWLSFSSPSPSWLHRSSTDFCGATRLQNMSKSKFSFTPIMAALFAHKSHN